MLKISNIKYKLKDNFRILQPRSYFLIFLRQRDSWRQKVLSSIHRCRSAQLVCTVQFKRKKVVLKLKVHLVDILGLLITLHGLQEQWSSPSGREKLGREKL